MHDNSQFVPARFSRGAAIAWLAILPFSFELRAQDHSGETMEYSDKPYQSLIAKYAVADGDGVDYAAWQASAEDMAAMDDFIRLIGHVSPTSHPELFPSQDRAKSYWINAYNALVLDAVLDHWPLDSVRDVTVSLSSRILPGKGFFYDQDVVVGGEVTNLKKLEEHVLESLDDPRLHFALNCASESCPVLRASDWSNAELDQAARDFVNNVENVEVADGRLVLSRIFKWYKKDFPRDIASYLKSYAGPGLEAQLAVAIAEDYPVTYRDYDWSLNASGGE